MIALIGVAAAAFGAAWFGVHALTTMLMSRQARARAVADPHAADRLRFLFRAKFVRTIAAWIGPRLPRHVRCHMVIALSRADLAETGTPEEWIVATLLLGGVIPMLWIWRAGHRRGAAILQALPLAVELLALAVEAGSDFMTALARVVERAPVGPLRAEWQRVLQAVRLGQSRSVALRTMADRVQLPAVGTVIMALVHADRLGAPLGGILRAEAAHLRFERFQQAERMGAAASQKVLLPIVVCILPAFMLLVLGGVLLGLAMGGI